MPDIEKAVSYMEEIAWNDAHGYSQENRYGKPDFDCSSLVAKALSVGGFDIKLTSYTGNLYQQLVKAGFVEKPVRGERKRGDILLTPGHHVVMCTDADHIVHASINELGGVCGGEPGDQTGKEICVRDYYTPSYGWDYHLRYEPKEETEGYQILYAPQVLIDVIIGKYGNYPERKEKLEAEGYDYTTIQKLVNEMLKGE